MTTGNSAGTFLSAFAAMSQVVLRRVILDGFAFSLGSIPPPSDRQSHPQAHRPACVRVPDDDGRQPSRRELSARPHRGKPHRPRSGVHHHGGRSALFARTRHHFAAERHLAHPRRREPQRHFRQRSENRRSGAGRRPQCARWHYRVRVSFDRSAADSRLGHRQKTTSPRRSSRISRSTGSRRSRACWRRSRDSQRTKELLLLYQFSIKLLGCDSPDDVVSTSLELLMDWTRATVAGFLWLNDNGELKPAPGAYPPTPRGK